MMISFQSKRPTFLCIGLLEHVGCLFFIHKTFIHTIFVRVGMIDIARRRQRMENIVENIFFFIVAC